MTSSLALRRYRFELAPQTCEATRLEATPTMPDRRAPPYSADDARLIAALRLGDEAAFEELIDRYSSALLRLAGEFVRSRAVAEEVVQETWVAVLQGVDRFEGRSSLKTWVFRILANKAKTRGIREGRTLPFSSFDSEGEEQSVPEERFRGSEDQWAGHWAAPPRPLAAVPEQHLLSQELRSRLGAALETLPDAQRMVVTMRDIAGHEPDEVCDLLGVTDANQRVLLHRGRSKLRSALEHYVEEA